jgi:hypothetical protein
MYHASPAKINIVLKSEANIPSIIKVNAVPKQKIMDVLKVFFLVVDVYPIIRGILDKLQGVKEVIIPANSARNGANK